MSLNINAIFVWRIQSINESKDSRYVKAAAPTGKDVINLSFAFLCYSDELNQMKILHNELLEAFNSSSEYISVKLKTVCPKYLGKIW